MMAKKSSFNFPNATNVGVPDVYTQSSNALFHFMDKKEYLIDALKRKALVPRYCIEDVEYLRISTESEGTFNRIAVLQKCFCDIQLSKIDIKSQVETIKQSKDAKNRRVKDWVSHTDVYGKYAIAFPKSWGKKNNIQAVHYVDEGSYFSNTFSQALCDFLDSDSEADSTIDNVLETQLSLVKPHSGKMQRKMIEQPQIITKNFYDEQEWRYVPKTENSKYGRIIANDNLFMAVLGRTSIIDSCNEEIRNDCNRGLWLCFDYGDISYLIVEDDIARGEIIDRILLLDTDEKSKYTLISKLLTLKQISEDM